LIASGQPSPSQASNPPFAGLATEGLHLGLGGLELDRPVEEAVANIMDGFAELHMHPDVPDGLSALAELGIRLVTLSNGSASIAQRPLSGAGLGCHFERFLSVEGALIWKPASAAYAYGLAECGVKPADTMPVAAHTWDTDGAQRAGLTSARINRTRSAFPTTSSRRPSRSTLCRSLRTGCADPSLNGRGRWFPRDHVGPQGSARLAAAGGATT